MAWGAICLPKTRQRPISVPPLARAGVAEAARFGQLSVLAQRRVLSRWNWLMIPLMRTTLLRTCPMVRLSSSKEKTSITPTTRHLPRLQVRHQQRRSRRHLHGPCRRQSRGRRHRLRSRGRRRGRGIRR